MRLTLSIAAFTIVAVHSLPSHALPSDAGAAGSTDAAGASNEAGAAGSAASEAGAGGAADAAPSSGGASAGTGGSGGKGGSGGTAGAPAAKPVVNLPDPGTRQPGVSCSLAGPNAPWNLFGASLALGAACLTLRRRRSR